MPEYSIEMLWTCRVCNRVGNRGLRRHCGGCGHPKDDRDEEFFPDDISIKNALDGEEERRANAGADYHCKYCRSLQSALNLFCEECGADQKSAAEAWEATDKTATLDVRTGEKHESTGDRVKVEPGGDTPSPDESEVERVASTPPSMTFSGRDTASGNYEQVMGRMRRPPVVVVSRRRFGRMAAGLAAALLLGFGLWWLLHPRYESGLVVAVQWERRIDVERYQLWQREGWAPPLTAVGLVDEGSRVHHTNYHVLVGSHKETVTDATACGQTCTKVKGVCSGKTPVSCKPRKNGTAKCTGGDPICTPDSQSCVAKTCETTVKEYADIPVWQEWYGWSEWDWGFNRTVRRSGTDLAPRWPTDEQLVAPLGAGENERQGSRVESYEVTFQSASGPYKFAPNTEGEFLRYRMGGRWRLKRNAFGVTDVLPL